MLRKSVCVGIDPRVQAGFRVEVAQPSPIESVHMSSLHDELAQAFRSRFQCEPEFAAMAPGRVNLIGEHTDYNLGFVLPVAIDRHTLILAVRVDRRPSVIWSCTLRQQFETDFGGELKPQKGSDAFANYVLGVVEQFKQRGLDVPNFRMAIASNVPLGAGLSSSAALEVATATLIEMALNVRMSKLEKALLCQKAEHEFPGAPVGIMDMYVSAAARADHAMLIDCRSNELEHVPLPPVSDAVLLIADTGVEHELSARGSEYAVRKAECAAAARKLGAASLRDADSEMIRQSRILSETERLRALHVVCENNRTQRAAAALRKGALDDFGALMFASHDSLRDLFEVSVPELDVLVQAARELRAQGGDAPAVFGSRMTGGGFGGCTITLCRASHVDQVQQHLEARFERAFQRKPTMFTTGASNGALAQFLH